MDHATTVRAWTDDRHGAALIVVLLGLVVLSLLATASAGISGDEHRAARAVREGSSSMYVAETGLHQTLGEWPDSAVGVMSSGDSLDLGWTDLSDGSRFRAVIRKASAAGDQPLQVVRVTGQSGGPVAGEATMELWVTSSSVFPAFPGAINATGDVSLSGSGITDSYDSSLGPYGGANVASNGDVFANGDVTPSGGGLVDGDATAGGLVSDPTAVTGASTSFAPPTDYPSAQCPAGGYTPSASMPLGPGVSYDEITGIYQLQADSIVWSGGSYYIHELRANSNTILYILPGNQVTLFVDGLLHFNGGATINNYNDDPADLIIIGCGDGLKNDSSREEWTLNGGAEAYMSIYAPQFDLKITGGAPLYGAAVGYDVDVSTAVHYDENLGSMALSLGVRAIERPWLQLIQGVP